MHCSLQEELRLNIWCFDVHQNDSRNGLLPTPTNSKTEISHEKKKNYTVAEMIKIICCHEY